LQIPRFAVKALDLLCSDLVVVEVVEGSGLLDKEIRLRKAKPEDFARPDWG
jgi:hypothetical protein